MSPADQGDNNATFLAQFRALRDRAGLDYVELAAKTHFPTDVLRDAEAGPGLPGLPVLAAYVRACEADVAEWEERWRLLADGQPGLLLDAERDESGLPVRPAGASPAAVAGARAGVTVAPADVHDPERIKAALRAHRTREDKSVPGHDPASVSSGWDSGPGSSANGGSTTTLANGHHHGQNGLGTTNVDSAGHTPDPSHAPDPSYAEPFAVDDSPTAGPDTATAASAAAGSSAGHSTLGGTSRATATRARRTAGNTRIKIAIAAVVAVVVIGCILLIALV
ncbi:MAG TPA: helix-turn-helix transcriptional regulator [Streptosporangiaceae bacterium]